MCLTQAIQCFMPIVNLLVAVAMALVKRGMDTKFTFDPFMTKKKNMLDYMSVYDGGNF